MFRAGEQEFRHRYAIISAVYWASFAAYWIDHQNAAVALARQLAHSLHRSMSATDIRIVFGVGAVIALAAAAIRTWGTSYLSAEVMTDERLHTSALVADGPFRFVRNPLYLGNILLALGFATLTSRLGAVIMIAGNWLVVRRLIGREERELLAAQGESYAAYLRAVPRLWPSLTPRLPAAGNSMALGAGILGELFNWCLALNVVVMAITLAPRIFFVTLGFSFAIEILRWVLIKRRSRSAGAAA